jgi:hypothetical protein
LRVELEFLMMRAPSVVDSRFIHSTNQTTTTRRASSYHIITSSNDDLLIKNYVTRDPSLSRRDARRARSRSIHPRERARQSSPKSATHTSRTPVTRT